MTTRIVLALLPLLAALLHQTSAAHWVLLVAGSSGYYNYRHQADICHAYQIMHKNGIPDANIVVMMYDDIANSRSNPTPGIIINRPDGEDVYKGVPHDYIGKDVTAQNFLKILQGQDMTGIGSGKTIKSTKDDHVFVYFADHGAPNLIAFPHDELHAKDLQEAILAMNASRSYNKMVFYVEACESGSMFNRHKLPNDINIYATTAANGQESSYACYWDKKRRTYLGDVYSIKWLQDSDKADMSKETLFEQFTVVKKETTSSHVQEFGDFNLGKTGVLGQYQSELPLPNHSNTTKSLGTDVGAKDPCLEDAVPSDDVILSTLHRSVRDSHDVYERASLIYQLEVERDNRAKIVDTVTKIAGHVYASKTKVNRMLTAYPDVEEPTCYKKVVTHFRSKCFDFNKYEYALRQIYVLANLCDDGLQTDLILGAIDAAC